MNPTLNQTLKKQSLIPARLLKTQERGHKYFVITNELRRMRKSLLWGLPDRGAVGVDQLE